MKDLKPCPFCGGKVSIIHEHDNGRDMFSVWHEENNCIFVEPLWLDCPSSLSEARELWNRRADTTIVNNGTMNITL